MRLLNNLVIFNPGNLNFDRKRKTRHTLTCTKMRLHVHRRVLDVLAGVAGDGLDGTEKTRRVARGEELLRVGAHACSTEGLGHRERDGGVHWAVSVACY